MLRDVISESLDTEVVPLEDIRYLVSAVKEETTKESLDADFSYVRRNLKAIIEKGMMSVGRIIDIATESESARNIEAAGAYIKTLAELNTSLFDMTEKKLKTEEGETTPSSVQNNAFFLTSEELIKGIGEKLALSPANPLLNVSNQ